MPPRPRSPEGGEALEKERDDMAGNEGTSVHAPQQEVRLG